MEACGNSPILPARDLDIVLAVRRFTVVQISRSARNRAVRWVVDRMSQEIGLQVLHSVRSIRFRSRGVARFECGNMRGLSKGQAIPRSNVPDVPTQIVRPYREHSARIEKGSMRRYK